MPDGLTQTKPPTFSETWPEIDRNGGRLHFGMVAGFTSENPAGINRNPHTGSPGPGVADRTANIAPHARNGIERRRRGCGEVFPAPGRPRARAEAKAAVACGPGLEDWKTNRDAR